MKDINLNIMKMNILFLILITVSPIIDIKYKLMLVIYLILYFTKKLGLKKILFTSILIVFFTIFFIIKNISTFDLFNGGFYYIFIPLNFLLGYLVNKSYPLKYFLQEYEKIIFITSIISLGCMLLTKFYPDIIFLFNEYKPQRRTIYIYNFLLNTPTSVWFRNSGIAWEPGVYQFLLNLSLGSYIYQKKRKISSIKIIIYLMNILLTFSTIGLINLIFNLLLIFKYAKKKLKIFIVLAILFSAPILFNIYNQHIYEKITSGESGITGRTKPIVESLNYIIKKDFLFGEGFNNILENKLAFADSYTHILVTLGLIVMILLVLSIIGFYKMPVLMLIIFFSYTNEVIWFYPFMTYFYFKGFTSLFSFKV